MVLAGILSLMVLAGIVSLVVLAGIVSLVVFAGIMSLMILAGVTGAGTHFLRYLPQLALGFFCFFYFPCCYYLYTISTL